MMREGDLTVDRIGMPLDVPEYQQIRDMATNTAGVIMLLVTLLTCGIGGSVMGIIGIIEGIIYLTKSDADFVATYITNKKEWF